MCRVAWVISPPTKIRKKGTAGKTGSPLLHSLRVHIISVIVSFKFDNTDFR